MARSSADTAKPQIVPVTIGTLLRRRAIEAGGVLLIGTALALIMALVSYSPHDPSPNLATAGPVRNLLGLPGAYVADVLLRTLGLGALAVAGLIAAWGWRVASHRGVSHPTARIAVLPVALVLTSMALAGLPTPAVWPLREGLGGGIGLLLLGRSGGVAHALGFTVAGNAVALGAAWLAIGTFGWCLGFKVGEWQIFGKAIGRATRAMLRCLAFLLRKAWAALAPRLRLPALDLSAFRLPRLGAERAARTGGRERVAPELSHPRRPRRELPPEAEGDRDEAERPGRAAPERRAAAAERPARRLETVRPVKAEQIGLPLDESYQLPPLELLQLPRRIGHDADMDDEALAQNARLLESVLNDFGVRGQIVDWRPGPVVTLYELEPAPGTKSSRVIGLADDIARSMSAVSVRVAVVPGRNVIGIELPNKRRETVFLRELLASSAYADARVDLPLALGKDIGGGPVVVALERMPHLLIAGTTGSGKSVAINTMVLSLLYRLPPERCRLIMIDPKMLELSVYEGIPHLLAPVVTDPRKAVSALKWTVREMESRYRAMSTLGVRNIAGYNARLEEARTRGEVLTRRVQTGYDPDSGRPVYEEQPLDMTPLAQIVVIVDEMADLMLIAGKDIEAAIQRLAQMARAAGIHLIMATQRPSVDVITGTIKANFPTRISFQVTSKIDSRTILNEGGAEQLLGQGDMLYMAGGGRITRVHGPFVSDSEVEEIVSFIRRQGEPAYLDAVTEDADEGMPGELGDGPTLEGDADLYDQAVAVVLRERRASTSLIQRHLRIGYNRAATLIERMEKEGVISPANHAGKREILVGSGED